MSTKTEPAEKKAWLRSYREAKWLDELKALAASYAAERDGRWLTEVNWRDVPVTMKELPEDVCGKYSFGKISLRECLEPSFIFPTYIHELRHHWQWKKHPIFYLVGKIIRPLIEDDAVCQETAAENWLEANDKRRRDTPMPAEIS